MKRVWKRIALMLSAVILIVNFSTAARVNAESDKKTLDILFAHDTHSHLNSFSTVVDGEETEIGGFSRMKTLINEKKKENPDTLMLDGGDFSMGTLVQSIFEEEASELRMIGSLGCDVTTFGNHEYDYRAEGLANMLKSAKDSGDRLPSIVLSNVDWDAMEAEGLTDEQKKLKDAFDYYGVKDYTVIQKGNVKIAVFGIFGEDALSCAPTCVLKFKDPVKAAKETVEKIKSDEDVDMIACVSHSGTWSDEKKSEDEILAKGVPDIDLIISGHTHSKLDTPICHGDTYIVSAGEYGKYLGSLSMEQKDDGRWNITDYSLIPVTADISEDEETQNKIDRFMEIVDEKYLKKFGYTRDEVLAENDVTFSQLSDMSESHKEENLGSIMADAYIYAAEKWDKNDTNPVDVAVVPSGTVRDTYTHGDITVEDVFNSFSLGIGADGVPGYPLVSVYLTGKELKTVAEIDASISDIMNYARIYMSGLNMAYNPHRLILNKVTDVYLTDKDGRRKEIQDDKMYRVVSDLYSGQMLSTVTNISKGILSIVPKDADGNPVTNFEDAAIISDGKELKAWDAIARYMKSFKDENGDGVPDVPQYYSEPQGRKVVEDSRNIIDLVKNPNKYAAMILGIGAAAIALIVLIIFGIKKIIRSIKRKKQIA